MVLYLPCASQILLVPRCSEREFDQEADSRYSLMFTCYTPRPSIVSAPQQKYCRDFQECVPFRFAWQSTPGGRCNKKLLDAILFPSLELLGLLWCGCTERSFCQGNDLFGGWEWNICPPPRPNICPGLADISPGAANLPPGGQMFAPGRGKLSIRFPGRSSVRLGSRG